MSKADQSETIFDTLDSFLDLGSEIGEGASNRPIFHYL